jgi:deaminated glutathione amidase
MRAAAVQLTATEDTACNRETADRLVREAAARGAQLVVLPEKWTVLGSDAAMDAAAEPLDGPALTWARGAARELGIDLVAGSIVERRPGHERHGNTSVHIGPDGEVSAVYRKIHLFDVEVGGRAYRESDTDEPGDEVVLSELQGGVGLGLTICYDVRFPELYRVLAVRGARVLVVPAAFTVPTTRDHWEPLLRARAIENGCFVVAANQVGRHGAGFESGGRSLILDPWGRILAEGSTDREALLVADLDLEAQDEVRSRMPLLTHRRPEVYRWPEEVRT